MIHRSARRAAIAVALAAPLAFVAGCSDDAPQESETAAEAPDSSPSVDTASSPAATGETSPSEPQDEGSGGASASASSGGSADSSVTEESSIGTPAESGSSGGSSDAPSSEPSGPRPQDDIDIRGGGAVQKPESGDTTPFAWTPLPEESEASDVEPAIASTPVWRTDWYVQQASGNALWLTNTEKRPTAVAVVSGDGKVLWEESLVEGAMEAPGEVTDFAITTEEDAFIVTRIVNPTEEVDTLAKAGRAAEAWKVSRDGAQRIPFPEGETFKLADEDEDRTYMSAVPGGFEGQEEVTFQAVTDGNDSMTMEVIDPDLHVGRSFTAGWLRTNEDNGEALTLRSDAYEGRDVSAGGDYLSPRTFEWSLDDMVGVDLGAGRVLDLADGEVYNSDDECDLPNRARASASPDRRYMVYGPLIIDRELQKTICTAATTESYGVDYQFVTDEGVAYGWSEDRARWVTTSFEQKPTVLDATSVMEGSFATSQVERNTFSTVGDGLLVQRSSDFEGAVIWQLDGSPEE